MCVPNKKRFATSNFSRVRAREVQGRRWKIATLLCVRAAMLECFCDNVINKAAESGAAREEADQHTPMDTPISGAHHHQHIWQRIFSLLRSRSSAAACTQMSHHPPLGKHCSARFQSRARSNGLHLNKAVFCRAAVPAAKQNNNGFL